jgi:small subunit ribosomal protein S16
MKSMGRLHRPFFRICAMDSRTPRDGTTIEELGYYDPLAKTPESREVLKVDRITYWLTVGAEPSEKVAAILARHGVVKPNASTHGKRPRKRNRAKTKAVAARKAEVKSEARKAKLAAKAAPAPAASAEEIPAGSE